MEWREQDGLRWLQAELPGARAVFSSRLGGVSERQHEALNLGLLTGDDRGFVVENRHRLAQALELDPARVVIGRQVHGAELASHVEPQEPAHFATPGEAPPPAVDGHSTAEVDLALLVLVADCVPIALSGPGGVAMLHGGWRGLAAGIVGKGAAAVEATHAAVGPAIGPCCFEVGEEVLAAFAPLGPGVSRGSHIDLRAATSALLERAGVEQLEVSDLCTRCNPDLFFSHRGQGADSGRHAGMIWRTAER